MKTTLNVTELVQAFRAEQQERIDAERRDKEQRQLANEEQHRSRCALMQEVWPLFREAILSIPGAEITREPSANSCSATFRVTAKSKWPSHGTYKVDRVIGVSAYSETSKFTLDCGEHGGLLLTDTGLRPGSWENPADLVVLLAQFAGCAIARGYHLD